MTIFDVFVIYSNFLFLEVVTLAYFINRQSTAANVSIFGNVTAHTSQHPPLSFNHWLTLLNLPFRVSNNHLASRVTRKIPCQRILLIDNNCYHWSTKVFLYDNK